MDPPVPRHAPETWEPARRIAERVFQPLQRFLQVQAASGIVLLAAATVAIVWANSPWSHSYEALWHTPVVLGVGSFELRETLHFWVNDGLMAIFFLVAGMEIRREIHQGELSELKRAALPVVAALGGMLFPALIYLSLNFAPGVRRGWGVPAATDIAFAVGVLALLGNRVAPALRVLLLALAVIDDIGAIVIIALFYSGAVSFDGVLIAVAGGLGLLAMQRFGVRRSLAYVVPSMVVWWGMYRSGIHPAIAGVVIGMLTPVRPWLGAEGFMRETRRVLGVADEDGGAQGDELMGVLERVRHAQREALPPVVRIQAALNPWVAYGIMPLFALANAGVDLRGAAFGGHAPGSIVIGVLLGLLIGKPIGVSLACWATVRLGWCALPRGVGWRGILLVGCVAGIGFTMAIFTAGLAFPDPDWLAAAKVGVLGGSTLAAIIGIILGRTVLLDAPDAGAARTVDEAEASTEL